MQWVLPIDADGSTRADGRLWTVALIASIGVHGALAAGLAHLPAAGRAHAIETTFDILTAPRDALENVAAPQTARPAAAQTSAIGNSGEPATVLDASGPAGAEAPFSPVNAEPAAAATSSAEPQIAAAVQATQSETSQLQLMNPQVLAPSVTDNPTVAGQPVPAAVPAASAEHRDAIPQPPPAQPPASTEARATPVAARPAEGGAVAPAAGGGVVVPRDERIGAETASPQPQAVLPGIVATGPVGFVEPPAVIALPQPFAPPPLAPVRTGPGDMPVASVPVLAPTASAEAEEEVAMLVPRPAAPPIPPAVEVDPRERILDHLASYDGGRCFLALVSPGQGGRLSVDGFASAPDRVAALGEELARLAGAPVETRTHGVTPAQCGALSFARVLAPRPLPVLDIRPDMRTVESGALLSGSIGKPGRRWLYLLLVDDDGKVQELHDLFQDAAGGIGFNASVTLTGEPVSTAQLLLAVATDQPLDTFASHDGEQADVYFRALADEIARTRGEVDYGFTFFFVR